MHNTCQVSPDSVMAVKATINMSLMINNIANERMTLGANNNI